MSMRYEEVARLRRGLKGGVSAVAFSPNGTFLATAGMKDAKVYIWRVDDSKLLHTYVGGDRPVLSLEWIPGRNDRVLCGSNDGYIFELKFDADIYESSGFCAHGYPVERLAAKGSQLVSGAHREVSVWTQVRGAWRYQGDLLGPVADSQNADEELIVVGIHWTKIKYYASVVVMTYMHHGIVIYNSHDWSRIHSIPFRDIGASSMSPRGSLIALSIMGSGFDLYNLDTGDCAGSFSDESGRVRTVPVLFVHGGVAVLSGSTIGRATLWNASSQRVHQTFQPDPYDTILAIDANYNSELDRFLLAMGANDGAGESAVIVWLGREGSDRRKDVSWKQRMLTYAVRAVLATVVAVAALVISARVKIQL
ncbi:WD40 repeat-like protein [Polyporus arcularius HHB13444]|uniref:WD40 repeat-like protein n=1 Tax=Polyporus arcularius HHB13444 TaxID=1314778 RepID=A0A5C3NUM5_9APHY|nr:WD40 repeat-like protein [Polyporus arcularius HHB13444]